jgi:hypothetical protein
MMSQVACSPTFDTTDANALHTTMEPLTAVHDCEHMAGFPSHFAPLIRANCKRYKQTSRDELRGCSRTASLIKVANLLSEKTRRKNHQKQKFYKFYKLPVSFCHAHLSVCCLEEAFSKGTQQNESSLFVFCGQISAEV